MCISAIPRSGNAAYAKSTKEKYNIIVISLNCLREISNLKARFTDLCNVFRRRAFCINANVNPPVLGRIALCCPS